MNILVIGGVDRVLSDELVSLSTETAGLAVLLVSDMSRAIQVIESGFGANIVLLVRPDSNQLLREGIEYLRLLPSSGDPLRLVVLHDEMEPECLRLLDRHGVKGVVNIRDLLQYIDFVREVGISRSAFSNNKTTLLYRKRALTSHPGVKRGLTPRQYEVLSLLNHGKSNKQIARDLELTEGTVKVHCKAIFRTLGVVNRTQAAVLLAESTPVESCMA